MSTENLAKFRELLKTDPELKLAVQSIDGDPQTIAEKIAALAAAVHTPFTAAEYLQNASSVDDELSDSTLDRVVGGMRNNPYFGQEPQPPL